VESLEALFRWLALPGWAPNLHPLIVHFPIAWLIAAVVVDLVSLALPRVSRGGITATSLYVAGAISALMAYLTGRQAAQTVLVPGMAQPIMVDHWNWALATTIYFAALAALRLLAAVTRRPLPLWLRAAAVGAALAGMLLLFHTGEQGARLVFEHGVGVMPALHRGTLPVTR
jgi:uncharacterized membrane protein